MRNWKGRLPNIVVVTTEPLSSRLSSLALGRGDIDCLDREAPPELQAAVLASGDRKARRLMDTMVDGHRLRDISDLALDALLYRRAASISAAVTDDGGSDGCCLAGFAKAPEFVTDCNAVTGRRNRDAH